MIQTCASINVKRRAFELYPFIPWSFLGLDSSEASYDKAKFIVVPVPYDSTESYRAGSRNGPHQVIDASRYIELFDLESQSEPYKKGICTLEEMEVIRGNPLEMLDRIRTSVKKLVDDNKIPILIGGEHTISLGAVMAFNDDVIVVDLDAHSDLRNSYEGSPYSHACVMRRIFESGRSLIEVGARAMSQEEFNFAKEKNIPIYFSAMLRKNFRTLLTEISKQIKGKNVYLSIDADVFDPSEAPGVSTPEPDGLTFSEVKEIIKTICNSAVIKGVDLVEVTPIPGNNITEFLSARILYKTIGYIK
jgi:agmatinase